MGVGNAAVVCGVHTDSLGDERAARNSERCVRSRADEPAAAVRRRRDARERADEQHEFEKQRCDLVRGRYAPEILRAQQVGRAVRRALWSTDCSSTSRRAPRVRVCVMSQKILYLLE